MLVSGTNKYNKTGTTDRNTRTNDQSQNQTIDERSNVSSAKTKSAKNITSIPISAEKYAKIGTANLNTCQNVNADRKMVGPTIQTDKSTSVVHGTTTCLLNFFSMT